MTCFINFLSSVSVFSLASSENAAAVVKPKGRAGSKKAQSTVSVLQQEKLSPVLDDFDEDDEIESLKDRLNAYRLDSSPVILMAGLFYHHRYGN